MREDSTMRKITRSKHPEKRRNTKWNASGSTLAMNRQVVDSCLCNDVCNDCKLDFIIHFTNGL